MRTEEKREYDRQRYVDNRDVVKARSRARHSINRDEILEQQRAYRAKNRKVQQVREISWRDGNRDQWRETQRRGQAARRARKLGQFVEHVDPAVVWEREGGICHICGLPADPNLWHLEHVVALVNGGDHSYANTAVSHPACNFAKGVN